MQLLDSDCDNGKTRNLYPITGGLSIQNEAYVANLALASRPEKTENALLMSTRSRLVSLLLLLALAGVLHLRIKNFPEAEEIENSTRFMSLPGMWQGKVARDFSVELAGGDTFALGDHVGRRVVILNFFTTWCGPCRTEMPELNRFRETRGDGIVMIAIDCGDKPEDVEAFIEQVEPTFPVGLDPERRVMRLYGVSSFPTTVLVDANGRIALYEVGAIRNADVALGPAVAANLSIIEQGGGITPERYRRLLERGAEKSDAPPPEDSGLPMEEEP